MVEALIAEVDGQIAVSFTVSMSVTAEDYAKFEYVELGYPVRSGSQEAVQPVAGAGSVGAASTGIKKLYGRRCLKRLQN